jgi:hypothetical protein
MAVAILARPTRTPRLASWPTPATSSASASATATTAAASWPASPASAARDRSELTLGPPARAPERAALDVVCHSPARRRLPGHVARLRVARLLPTDLQRACLSRLRLLPTDLQRALSLGVQRNTAPAPARGRAVSLRRAGVRPGLGGGRWGQAVTSGREAPHVLDQATSRRTGPHRAHRARDPRGAGACRRGHRRATVSNTVAAPPGAGRFT